MRRILFLSLGIFLYLSCSKSNSSSSSPSTAEVDTLNNWVKLSNAGFELDDIWFTDVKTGFVAGATSIFTTTDTGNTWAAILRYLISKPKTAGLFISRQNRYRRQTG